MRSTWVSGAGMITLVGALSLAGCGSGGDPAAVAQSSGVIDLSGVTPNWDKALPAASRFTVLAAFNNEAVRDNETGLVWGKSPTTTTHTWSNARSSCAERPVGGRMGWRLPSVHELMSLVDPTQSNPSLPAGHPFLNVQSSLYWSATTSAEDPALAWYVGFFNGNLSSPNGKNNTYNFWCVRGGGPLSEY
ncbi:MAG: DUF1566 domain-containing protein [Nitrospirota bacterium]|nr:DUF1566 domain-containing protein [Nitrospirota bacterium]